ncbi:MAG: hypothetical protein ACWA44_14125 [Thiotrichales bacterium]
MKSPVSIDSVATSAGSVWPGPRYEQQIRRLREAVGSEIYLAEVNQSEINLSITLQSKPYDLLAVVDFPRPDPAQGLYPHLLVLGDGRGINLGRIARISLKSSFQPEPQDILFQDEKVLEELLFCERKLSREEVKAISKAQLGALLGKAPEAENGLLEPNRTEGLAGPANQTN